MTPCRAWRSARLSALVMFFLRRISAALSKSPPASSSALLQSIIPASVRARSSAISFGVILSATGVIPSSPFWTVQERRPRAVWGSRGRRSMNHRPGRRRLLAFAPATRFGRRGGRRVLRLHPRGDRLRLRPPLAARRLLLAIALGFGLHARLGRVRGALALLGRLPQRLLPPRLGDHVGDRRRDER